MSDAAQDPRAEAQARAEMAYAEVAEVLRRHGCRIVATLTVDGVGDTANRALVTAGWAVVPGKLPE